jgi:threonine dehydrogenase-like Zn-dependent dehydrogenase
MKGLKQRIKNVTSGREADVCLEIVGLTLALRLAIDVIRLWDIVGSVGVHNGEVGSRFHYR